MRALVEKVFGTLKRSYGCRRVRYCGLERNAAEMWLKLMAYNLRKVVALTAIGRIKRKDREKQRELGHLDSTGPDHYRPGDDS